jgi:hypothetical protein
MDSCRSVKQYAKSPVLGSVPPKAVVASVLASCTRTAGLCCSESPVVLLLLADCSRERAMRSTSKRPSPKMLLEVSAAVGCWARGSL